MGKCHAFVYVNEWILDFPNGYPREFSNERGRVERRAQYHKARTRKMFIEAMAAYLDWITQAGRRIVFHLS